ncbi:hypothetical protein PDTK01_08110 [Phycicoccus sp. DTK01]|nr:hypothetical protein PDTK01_08110 [Phycicoccus sp. DTK01]
MPMAPAPLRTFIYGSCVSRDTFEFLRPGGYALLDYVARTSLVSAFAPSGLADVGTVETTSSFQRRMLESDWRGGLVPLLESRADQVDVLLWDLCDERLGLRDLGEGRYLTRSVDLISTGVDGRLKDRSVVLELGDPAHRAVWDDALGRWRELLGGLGLLDRVVLLAPPWAVEAGDGTPSPTSFGRTAQEANALFAGYVDAAAEVIGCPVVTGDEGAVRSDPGHQWGFAPFHYAAETYVGLAGAIDDAASGLPRAGAPAL